MSERAMEKLHSRKTKPATFNLDMNLIGDYWGWFGKRSYHHTGMKGKKTPLQPPMAHATSQEQSPAETAVVALSCCIGVC